MAKTLLKWKQDILKYLNNLRKSSEDDPSHKWIGSYNGRQAVFLKFFKWLHNLGEPDYRKRNIPDCMQGIKKLNRKEKTPYRSSDVWNSKEHSLFLNDLGLSLDWWKWLLLHRHHHQLLRYMKIKIFLQIKDLFML